ncbi:MAG: PQQ-dependent sugar dehydrogenase [Prosthecobacter sp.]|nr:PQQ-dependent sugar dehydrogenase [Prosthecobacter sp.]
MTLRLTLLLLMGAAFLQAEARTPWTTSRVQGSPEPPKPFVAEPVYSQIKVENGLELVAAGGRFYMVTREGKVWSFPIQEDAGPPELVLDLKALHPEHDSAYSIAFHPRWRENRQVFVCYTYAQGVADGSKLSRFRLTDTEPPKIDPQSEEVLLTWLAGGHNGSQLQFGPDGFLYFSTGDAKAPSPPDELNTGQDNSDLLSCILRIDVDRQEAGRAYAVPPDNPFVGKPHVRPEIWAFGFRNPWRISFDPANGRLWCGDVGWELWEMIHLVKRGGNSGWSAMESVQPIKPETLSPLAPITPPVVAHPHTEAASITGGYVYHGKRLPELRGAYIYGDYETGKIWALWHDGSKITRHEEIADTPHRIATFGLDEAGEIYYLHWGVPGGIYRLSRNPSVGKPSAFPRKLSETGLFADVAAQSPAPGVEEFQIAEPMWQDSAESRRFIGLPGETTITTKINRRKDGSIANSVVTWPTDAVMAKTLSWPGKTGRKIETQMLHFDGETWNGYSYRWNEKGTDADLVGANGEEGGPAQPWRFHGRAECVRCHNAWSGFALSFQPQQLKQQESPMADKDFFATSQARLVSSHDAHAPLEDRARSWLHANCAHCHRRHGGGSVPLMVNAELALAETALMNEKPTRGDFGIADAKVIAPGAPWQSVLPYRLAIQGSGHMPMIGAREVDVEGWRLLWQWIAGLPGSPEAAGATKADAADVPSAMRLVHALDAGQVAKPERDAAVQTALASPHANIRALFERFVPPEKRTVTLGPTIDATKLLALSGDAARGAALVSISGKCATCLACHFVNGTGRDFGPDLSKAGTRLTREQLLESLLLPSKVIVPEYLPYVVETKDGQTQMGFMVNQAGGGQALKLATGQTQPLVKSNIKSQKPLPMSLMPEGLLQSLTAQEAADLLAYLSSLK